MPAKFRWDTSIHGWVKTDGHHIGILFPV